MGVQQPFLYSTEKYSSAFPGTTFDPKAVTRASYAPKPQRPKPDGPLVSFNRHPDAHMILSYRSTNYVSMSPFTKGAVVWLRRIQLLLRILELNTAIGLLVLMVLITDVDALQGWIMRITAGIVILCCTYAIYHLSRSAAARAPASSAAYQLFAAATDLAVTPLYAYGCLAARNNGAQWHTRLDNADIMDVFVPTVYYLYISAGGMHFVSLCISAWLCWTFRKISLMPPDLNPLESHLTSRAKHKRNKSSVVTTSTTDDQSEKRLSTPMDSSRRSGQPYEDLTRPPTIPFLHTRTQSRESLASRDSRLDLPSRQYQIPPSNASPRNSGNSADFSRISLPRFTQHGRGSYAEIPLSETGSSRPSTGHSSVPRAGPPARTPKFSETWTPSDSLISRTQQRNRAMNSAAAAATMGGPRQRDSKTYEALTQRYSFPDSDSELDEHDENNLADSDFENNEPAGRGSQSGLHPNPLRSNPPTPPRAKTPFHPRASALSEVSQNERRVSDSVDIADERPLAAAASKPWQQRNRNSSIQPESDFYAKPYGELKAATPPIIVGSNRQVSSGNDYEVNSSAYGRRNVSGKIVEEGRAGRNSGYGNYRVVHE